MTRTTARCCCGRPRLLCVRLCVCVCVCVCSFDRVSEADNRLFLSGLLIGAEIGAAKITPECVTGAVTIIGSSQLGRRYKKALELIGYQHTLPLPRRHIFRSAHHAFCSDLFEARPAWTWCVCARALLTRVLFLMAQG